MSADVGTVGQSQSAPNSKRCATSYESTTAGETAINNSKEMTYVSAVLRIQAGGVEPFHCHMLLLNARFTSALLDLSFFFREDLVAKAAFVTASTAIDTLHMICMPLPSKRQMLGRRSRIPVSCAGCLVFIRPLFARVHEVTSAKWILDSTSLHLFEHKHQVWLCVADSLGIQPQTHKSGLHASVRAARLACVSWTTWAEA